MTALQQIGKTLVSCAGIFHNTYKLLLRAIIFHLNSWLTIMAFNNSKWPKRAFRCCMALQAWQT
jgi:hypothetical protein